MNHLKEKKEAFAELLEVIETLRKQCPWDKKQTFESLRSLTIEEVYELGDAILEKDVYKRQWNSLSGRIPAFWIC